MIPRKEIMGKLVLVPIVISAYLSGLFYLSAESAIPLTLFQIFLITGFIVFGIYRVLISNFEIELYGLEVQYLLLFTLIFVSILYTPERDQALFFAIRFIVLILFTYLIYNMVNSVDDLKILIFSIVLVSVFSSIISISNSLLNPEVVALNYLTQGRSLMRESGLEFDPNVYASNFFMPLMLMSSYVLLEVRNRWKILVVIALALVIVTILTTYSRSAWLSVIIAFLFIIHYSKKYSIVLYLVFFGVLILLFFPESRLFLMSIGDRFLNIFAGSSDDSSNIRIMLGIAAIQMLFDSYLIGIGFQGFSSYFPKYYTLQESLGIYEPHNEFYTFAAELGLLGLVLFCFIVYRILKTSVDNFKRSNESLKIISLGLFSSFIGYLIFYQFYGGMIYNSILFSLIGLIFSTQKIINQKEISSIITE